MSEPAFRHDVINALREAKGVSVTELGDGTIEVAALDQPIRRFALKPIVKRNLLWRFVGWYGVPIGAFIKSFRTKPESNASGE